MPWDIAHDGHTLHVRMSGEIGLDDWEAMTARVASELDAGVQVVTLPVRVPKASAYAQEFLEALWENLVARGVTVLREPTG